MFTYAADKVHATFGYHPDTSDLSDLVGGLDGARLLVIGHSVPDDHQNLAELRVVDATEVRLPCGLYAIYKYTTESYTEAELPTSGPRTGGPEEGIDRTFILYAGPSKITN
jgi:hypothetical protein